MEMDGFQNVVLFEVRCFCVKTAIELEIERQILEYVGYPTTAPAITPNCLPPVQANAQQLIGLEAVEAIPKLEFNRTANLEVDAGHDRLVADAGAHTDAEPVP